MVSDEKGIWRRKAKNKKSNSEQSDLCDLQQVTLKPASSPPLLDHLAAVQICNHSMLWRDSIRKGVDLEKQNYLIGDHPAELGKLTFVFFTRSFLFPGNFFPKVLKTFDKLESDCGNACEVIKVR